MTELKYICGYLFSLDLKFAFLLYTVILIDCKKYKSGISWKGFLLFQPHRNELLELAKFNHSTLTIQSQGKVHKAILIHCVIKSTLNENILKTHFSNVVNHIIYTSFPIIDFQ